MATDESQTFFGRSRAVTRGELTPTEDVKCPLCNITPKRFAVDYQGFTLCRCPGCKLKFVSPRLSFEELAEKVYADNYFAKRGEGRETSAEELDYYIRQIADFKRLLGTRTKILDIGCGNGAFLDFARGEGFDIAGVDIRLVPDAQDLGCPLWEGQLEEIDFGGEQFDLIRLNHVLEHTQNPLRELEICRELLRPGGILYISVPNMAGISARLKSLQSWWRFKAHRWRHFAAMHHLFFFSPATLRTMIGRSGLKVIYWNTPVPIKAGQTAWQRLYRSALERTRMSSILDLYATRE
jgi:2-polyprenyl-3-methyl-5-hydroxy-6-metoxy-1,4-benzoquinol methylase